MPSKLILSKRELMPDVYFTDTTKWTIGVDWTVFFNSAPGAIVSIATGSSLTLTDSPLRFSTAYKYNIKVASCSGINTFLIIGGNIIPIPASGVTQVLEGNIVTGAALNGVELLSSGGDTAQFYHLKITEYPGDVEIDITDDIDIPLTFSIADIKDPSKRNAAYSKQVTTPGTKTNNKYYTSIYEISGDGTFNPNKKCRAVVLEDGLELFNGVSQLKNINRIRNGNNNYNLITYEQVLLGKLADAFYLLGDTLLSDLDMSEYNHVYNITNQRDSWYTQIQKNGGNYTNSLNGGNLTISSCANNAGRVQINFSGAHGLAVDDWIIIPDNAITAGSEFYYGEHAVAEIFSSTAVILRCPFDVVAGTTLTTTNTVHRHTKTGEGYVYPMENKGVVTNNTWQVNKFYPAIYLVEYLTKIAKKIGFVFDGSFLTSAMIKKIIIPYNGGELKLTQEQVDAKKFRASSTAAGTGSYTLSPAYNNSGSSPTNYRGHAISGFGVGPGYVPFANAAPTVIDVPINDDSTLPNFDNGGTFNTGTYRWTCPISGTYDLSVAALVNNNYTLPGGVTQAESPDTLPSGLNPVRYNVNFSQSNSYGGAPQLKVEIYDYTTSNVVVPGSVTLNSFGTNQSLNPAIYSVFLTAGHAYGVRLFYNVPARAQFWSTQFTTPYAGDITVNYQVNAGCSFKNNITNNAIGDGDTLLMNIAIPQKVKCKDFLMSVIKAFNLYVQPDKDNDKKLYFETRNNFYASGQTNDWTRKLDIDSKLTITPMAELNAKVYEFKYADNKAPFGADHKSKYELGYGDLKYTVDNDFIPDSTNTIELIFAATVLSENVQGAGSGRIISETSTDALRMLYFNTSSTVNQVPNNTWTHSGLTGSFSRRIFPYAGHLDKVEAPNYDLNWFYPKGVYFDYDSWTNRGLFNQGYKQMIEEITDKNSRYVTGYFHLTAKDIFNLDFRDLFVVDGHFLRLNKVSDYLVNKNVPTLCEFIKVENKAPYVPTPYSSVQPINVIFDEDDRILNGGGNPEIVLDVNSSNRSSGQNVNGEGNVVNAGCRIVNINGDNNTVGAYCSNVTIQGDNNIVDSGLSNVSLINTSNQTITESDVSYVNGVLVTTDGDILVVSTDVYLDASYHGRILLIDATASNITIFWDYATMENCVVTIIRGDATGNIVSMSDVDLVATVIGNPTPYDLGTVIYDSMTFTSVGSVIYVI